MNYKTFLNLFVLMVLILPVVAFAQFKPLVGIPGVDGNADFNTYINALYALSISVAALIAVIKIIIAGVKWMLSDVVTSKQEAKSDMQGALIGLLIVISAVVILNVINPQLTETTLMIGRADAVPGSGITSAVNPPAAGAVIPAATDSCAEIVDAASGVRSYDCSVVNKKCTDAGGKVLPYISLGSPHPGKITCSYGTETKVTCSTIPSGDVDIDGAPIYVPDCTAEKAACSSKGGKVAADNVSSFICIIPY